jgi:hypothetical protein
LRGRTHSLRSRFSSVRQDWRAWLPEDKARVFQEFGQRFETAYTMLSVSLDEALALRDAGQIAKARQAAAVTAELIRHLSDPLIAMLRALESHARHHGIAPNAAPLDPANFRGNRCLRASRLNFLLSRILLSQRSQFLHKIHVLKEMVEDLQEEFGAALEELADGTSISPGDVWLSLDAHHYDLNTCLRETVVLFKSFLHVLPEEEVDDFELKARWKAPPAPSPKARPSDIRHRRPVAIAGE